MQPDALAKRSELLAPFGHFFTSSRHMFSWLQGLDGGRSVFLWTTAQEAQLWGTGGAQPLKVISLDSPALTLDYPLCVVDAPLQRPQEHDAAMAVHNYFLSDSVQDLVKRHGFKPRLDIPQQPQTEVVEALTQVLEDWPQRRSPVGLTVVMDSSMGVKGSLMTNLTKSIEQIAGGIPGDRGLSGLITCSQTAEKLIVSGGSTSAVSDALKGVHASGGLAFRDCLLEALQLVAFNTATTGTQQRREVLAFISGDDTSSKVPLDRFMAAAAQLMRQNRPNLHVVGVGSDINAFGEIPRIVQSLGGKFFLASQGEQLNNVVAQVRQVVQ